MADRILIVEDEEKLNRMIELELKYEGYETGKTLDGRTGLDMALSGGYDLVLLDIMLPGLNGLEVLRRIRKENERLPVILLTARDTTARETPARRATSWAVTLGLRGFIGGTSRQWAWDAAALR